ncbi:hypothetical protein QVD17_05726 [Tagetes erecta]|uniref:HTH myb-type domain-containing protein n=1 Tax=Tagetes erecta TaxID=13708 RepID=A0AAD8LJ79_TARER|nr:hypothetical protein QVD17_05726 [Tagetes erecta]
MPTLNSSILVDFNPPFIPKSITQFLSHLSTLDNVTDKLLQLNDFLNRLESETRQIEPFKRQIPLCMLIVNDAVDVLKEELMVLNRSSNAQPVLEEFIPIKKILDDDDDDAKVEIITNQIDNGDKKNWLSSTHLWNINENVNHSEAQIDKKKCEEEEEDAGTSVVNENSRLISCFTPNVQSNIHIQSHVIAKPQQHTFRKQRRCWSAELHRLFVNALQQLGGSQVATPKQIRELMKVDGLTNDEVKSHLQKYRLHIRKITSSKPSLSCVDVEGGSWMSKYSSSKSSSPDGPLLNGGNNSDDIEDEKSENYCWSGNL